MRQSDSRRMVRPAAQARPVQISGSFVVRRSLDGEVLASREHPAQLVAVRVVACTSENLHEHDVGRRQLIASHEVADRSVRRAVRRTHVFDPGRAVGEDHCLCEPSLAR